MDTQTPSMKSTIINFGLLLGGISVVFQLMLYFLDMHYKNPTFDRMYRDALSLVSDSLRIEKYKAMDSLALSESPVVPLYYDQVIRFVQKNIKGMEINPINLLVLKNVKKL